jgi:hypothetical protein
MSAVDLDVKRLARICSGMVAGDVGVSVLAEELAGVLPGLSFEHALTRGGWHRLGGVVDRDYKRVAEHIAQWAEKESGGDVELLVSRYHDAGYFATRFQGRTYYLVAPTGPAPEQFVQLEVEELQEVLDRFLIDPDWLPDDLEDFIDPIDYPRLEPEPVAAPRYSFRRFTRIADLFERSEGSTGFDLLRRFMADWQGSSAGLDHQFCRHWVLSLRENPSRDDGVLFSAKPTPAQPADGLPDLEGLEGSTGAELATGLHAFDRAVGYPFAWYFHMVTSTSIPSSIAEAVMRDLDGDYDYLPRCDFECLRAWVSKPYGV